MAQPHLAIQGLHVAVDGKPIVKGLDLTIKGGEVHAIMGPNGTGKSTLAQALMGHPRYEVTGGTVTLDGQDVLEMAVDERARAGLFLAMQYPSEIPGVSNANFIRLAVNARQGTGKEVPVMKFHRQLLTKMKELGMDAGFADRYLNEGFSGGEKKRNEMLQMAMLRPRIAILDEIDSGLDIDALKVVAKAVNDLRSPEMGVLMITHYQRLLEYIQPDFVHVLLNGRIVRSGGKELAAELEQKGYDWLKDEVGPEVVEVSDAVGQVEMEGRQESDAVGQVEMDGRKESDAVGQVEMEGKQESDAVGQGEEKVDAAPAVERGDGS